MGTFLIPSDHFRHICNIFSSKGVAGGLFYTGKNGSFRIKSYRKIGRDCLGTASFAKLILYGIFRTGMIYLVSNEDHRS